MEGGEGTFPWEPGGAKSKGLGGRRDREGDLGLSSRWEDKGAVDNGSGMALVRWGGDEMGGEEEPYSEDGVHWTLCLFSELPTTGVWFAGCGSDTDRWFQSMKPCDACAVLDSDSHHGHSVMCAGSHNDGLFPGKASNENQSSMGLDDASDCSDDKTCSECNCCESPRPSLLCWFSSKLDPGTAKWGFSFTLKTCSRMFRAVVQYWLSSALLGPRLLGMTLLSLLLLWSLLLKGFFLGSMLTGTTSFSLPLLLNLLEGVGAFSADASSWWILFSGWTEGLELSGVLCCQNPRAGGDGKVTGLPFGGKAGKAVA